MTDARLALLRLAACILLPTGLVALAAVVSRDATLRRRLAAHRAVLAADLRYLGAPLSAARLLALQAATASGLLVLALGLGSPWPLPPAAAVLIAPRLLLRRKRDARSARVERQLDAWLLALANALKANPALGDALASSVALTAPPLCEEIALLLKENRLGVPLDRAMQQLAARVRSPVVSAALATLRLARTSGGNLGETLESCAASLREMARLEAVVRTKTAEGRAQSLLIAAIPLPLVGLLQHLDPDLLQPLWATTRGHLVLAAAAALWCAAFLSARKILAVDL